MLHFHKYHVTYSLSLYIYKQKNALIKKSTEDD